MINEKFMQTAQEILNYLLSNPEHKITALDMKNEPFDMQIGEIKGFEPVKYARASRNGKLTMPEYVIYTNQALNWIQDAVIDAPKKCSPPQGGQNGG